jgi:hypothetical protein
MKEVHKNTIFRANRSKTICLIPLQIRFAQLWRIFFKQNEDQKRFTQTICLKDFRVGTFEPAIGSFCI